MMRLFRSNEDSALLRNSDCRRGTDYPSQADVWSEDRSTVTKDDRGLARTRSRRSLARQQQKQERDERLARRRQLRLQCKSDTTDGTANTGSNSSSSSSNRRLIVAEDYNFGQSPDPYQHSTSDMLLEEEDDDDETVSELQKQQQQQQRKSDTKQWEEKLNRQREQVDDNRARSHHRRNAPRPTREQDEWLKLTIEQRQASSRSVTTAATVATVASVATAAVANIVDAVITPTNSDVDAPAAADTERRQPPSPPHSLSSPKPASTTTATSTAAANDNDTHNPAVAPNAASLTSPPSVFQPQRTSSEIRPGRLTQQQKEQMWIQKLENDRKRQAQHSHHARNLTATSTSRQQDEWLKVAIQKKRLSEERRPSWLPRIFG